VEFYFQPALTEWEKANGFMRPENVVGSYAAYHKNKNGVHLNVADAEKYKCGKAFHIYRPKLIDATGKTAWADLTITANTLKITLPQEFLDEAVYPVTVDPTFGYETIGASSWSTANRITATRFSSGGTGTGQSITVYLQNAGGSGKKIKCALYDGNNLVSNGTTEEFSIPDPYSAQWKTLNFPTSPSILNQDYKICAWQNSNAYLRYDSSGVNQWSYQDITYDAWPNPANFSSEMPYKFSIYCTYTSGVVLKEVLDALSLTDTLLRDKDLGVSDSVGLADAPLKHWIPQVSDAISLSETVLRSRLLQALDLLGLSDVVNIDKALLLADQIQLGDDAYVNKVLAVSDLLALAEIVEKGMAGTVKTRVVLILGNVAIQLTG